MPHKRPGEKPDMGGEAISEGTGSARKERSVPRPDTDGASRSLRLDLRRTIAAPQGNAWDALTDPQLLSKWFTTRAKVDLRVGGRYSNSDGDEGSYLAIAPQRLLRFSWENRSHCPDTVVEVTLTPRGKGMVHVCLTHSKLRSKWDRDEMKEGWNWAMDSLRSFLETGDPIRHADWVKARKPRT